MLDQDGPNPILEKIDPRRRIISLGDLIRESVIEADDCQQHHTGAEKQSGETVLLKTASGHGAHGKKDSVQGRRVRPIISNCGDEANQIVFSPPAAPGIDRHRFLPQGKSGYRSAWQEFSGSIHVDFVGRETRH